MAAPQVPTTSQTLYLTNLNEKIPKDHLRRSLYYLFCTYGTVLDVVALKSPKMRGSAHVTFRDTPASVQAMRSLQGTEIFGREMKIAYSKSRAKIFAKLLGHYEPHPTIEKPSTVRSTELQKSIFDAPPSSTSAPTTTAGAENTLKPRLAAPAPPVVTPEMAKSMSPVPSKRKTDERGDDDTEMEEPARRKMKEMLRDAAEGERERERAKEKGKGKDVRMEESAEEEDEEDEDEEEDESAMEESDED
ncbi:hypothetical protein K402DRAFT_363047 [Aulographum hederae CBS 113979]|uniref:RRM domain-containing protein n=1 Tax=Aulographum hederae CBS 113979 TaxID=1176131 RepID=A0A6G1GN57_9PEZI|nr:hypothetical protein K402DRAFT_363047 [Aulographum hederae CBS 113979]